MRYCRNCGASVPQDAEFCNHCGTKLEKMKYCPFCGAAMLMEEEVCAECGRNLKPKANDKGSQTVMQSGPAPRKEPSCRTVTFTRPLKSKWVSFFLCLFFGWLGAHKFYEGKIGRGIFYLFTFGGFFIGWFMDLIAILFKPRYY